jgi:hypothetical protein
MIYPLEAYHFNQAESEKEALLDFISTCTLRSPMILHELGRG